MNWNEIVGEDYQDMDGVEEIETNITHTDENGNQVNTFIEASRYTGEDWAVFVYHYWTENGEDKMDTAGYNMDDESFLMYIKELRGEVKSVRIADLFEEATYEKNGNVEELHFERTFDVENGYMIAEYHLSKPEYADMWVGTVLKTVLGEHDIADTEIEKVAYSVADLFEIYANSSMPLHISEFVDEYASSETAEHVYWSWTHENEDLNRWGEMFASRVQNDTHWTVTMSLVNDDIGTTFYIGQLHHLELIEMIENFDEKYANKFYAEHFDA